MRRFLLLLICIGAACGIGACERHEWQETRKLHEHHAGGDGHAGHPDGQSEDGH